MRKTFSFEAPNHKPPRVVERVKAELNKYLKRERRKELPEGVDYWDFDCRAGKDEDSAEVVHVSQITKAVDEAFAAEYGQVYIEILAKEGRRQKREKVEEAASEDLSPEVPVEDFEDSEEE